jgi:hypothetical protein
MADLITRWGTELTEERESHQKSAGCSNKNVMYLKFQL